MMFMTGAILGWMLAGQTPREPNRLTFKDGTFTAVVAGKSESISTQSTEKPASKVYMFQSGRKWVVWDQRGLTIRVNTKAASTKLVEYPVSPKLFEKTEIETNLESIKKGTRTREASGLSGAVEDGKVVYLLVRWDEKGRPAKPWMEAIVKVDLNQDSPKPQLVGKFEGLSRSRGELIGSELRLVDQQLLSVSEVDSAWGVSRWNFETKKPSFNAVGQGLEAVAYQIGARRLLFIERTTYGTRLGGVLRLGNNERRNLLESREPFRFLPGANMIAVINSKDNWIVRSIESGSELTLPFNIGMAPAAAGLLVWTPKDRPQRAALYDVRKWTSLARWESAPARAPVAPTPRSSGRPTRSGTP